MWLSTAVRKFDDVPVILSNRPRRQRGYGQRLDNRPAYRQAGPPVELTVVSVHFVSFDILKSTSRTNQIERMETVLAHKKAVVIGGDLNISMRSRHMSTLMSKLPCSVIGFKITHPGRSIKPRKILVPVIGDGYKDMERADIIESFTRKFGSEITVFNVNELSSFHTKRLDKPDKDRLILSGEKKIKSFFIP